MYSPICHPRYSCLSFFSWKEISKIFWVYFSIQWRGLYMIPAEDQGSYLAKRSALKNIYIYIYMYILFKHKCCSSCTSSVMCMLVFIHNTIALERLVLCLCTSDQKGRVGWKTPSNFLLQLQNYLTSFFPFFCKGHLTFFAPSVCTHLGRYFRLSHVCVTM